MGKTVRQLQAEMDSAEFTEWMAFYNIEPFGERRNDLRFGILAASLKNSWRDPDSDPFAPEDFFPTLEDQAAPEEEDQEAIAEHIHASFMLLRQRMLAAGYPEAIPSPQSDQEAAAT